MHLTLKKCITAAGVALIDSNGTEVTYEELRSAARTVKEQFANFGIPEYSIIASLPSHTVEDVILLLAATDRYTHAPLNPMLTKGDFEFHFGDLQVFVLWPYIVAYYYVSNATNLSLSVLGQCIGHPD